MPGMTGERLEGCLERPSPYSERGVLFVPQEARWARTASGTHNINETRLRPALQALEGQNAKLRGLFNQLDFNRIGGSGATAGAAKLADQRLKLLIAHFGRVRLRTGRRGHPARASGTSDLPWSTTTTEGLRSV
ncbi:hypothetical protein GCM10010249_45100 [Streptomyces roseolilacinus]|uniref:Uncharacterized protein n=1 Tax=Streptomyces roseolilacinus TaxID=66904 RepID=A0A918EM84_9ACTN|nr:hypothetical protein GCM10010249_45100 [Streptomyces roseolilacinus]